MNYNDCIVPISVRRIEMIIQKKNVKIGKTIEKSHAVSNKSVHIRLFSYEMSPTRDVESILDENISCRILE